MPRGKRDDGLSAIAAASTPEARAKAKATRTKNVVKNRVRKLVGRLQELDLAPIDEEITRLRAEIDQLLATREIVSRIKGESGVKASQALRDKIKVVLLHAGPSPVREIAANLGGISEASVLTTLKQFADDFIPVENGKWAVGDD